MESSEGICLFPEYSLPLLNTVSVVNVLSWQEKKILFANRETEMEKCWRYLGVICRILIPGLVFALPDPSVLWGAACSSLSSAAAAVLMDGMWAALLKVSPGWVLGK